MREISFVKMHGLGNNYIYVNVFEEMLKEEDLPLLARRVADVSTGIGSDGLILICPSKKATVKMRIFNKDGSEGKNCGNGLRCVAKYAYEYGLTREKNFQIETLSGVMQVEICDNFVSVNMGVPIFVRNYRKQHYEGTGVSMGNPHIVFFVEDIQQAPLETFGKFVSKQEDVNVEFVEVTNQREIALQVWERGSGVTKACGTGACAGVVASVLHGKVDKNEEIIVHLSGGDLLIRWKKDNHVIMTGATETICTGKFYFKEER